MNQNNDTQESDMSNHHLHENIDDLGQLMMKSTIVMAPKENKIDVNIMDNAIVHEGFAEDNAIDRENGALFDI